MVNQTEQKQSNDSNQKQSNDSNQSNDSKQSETKQSYNQSYNKQSEQKQSETHQQTQQISEEGKTTVQVIAIFIFVWIILGLIALVWSIYCFGKSGSIFQKIVGILLAVFTGPLFFILYKYSPTYCK
jgi:uncharacterized ion transporter superfamily protein YfcC